MGDQIEIQRPQNRAFPVGGGELGRLIREFDWSKTSLGPIEAWPQSLKTATDIVLQSPLPLVMLWGPDGVMIYNDAYSEFAGQRHPRLLGAKVLEGWEEVADFNAHVMAEGLAGRSLSFKDQELTLYRNNAPEQVSMDLSYSPVLDESGKPAGVLAIVVETTGKMAAERALAAERAFVLEANRRLSAESTFLRDLFEQAPSFMAILSGPSHVYSLVNRVYQNLAGERELLGRTVKEALPELAEQGFTDLLDQVFRTGEPHVASGSRVMIHPPNQPEPSEHFLDFIYQPVRNAAGEVTGIFVEGHDVTDRIRSEQHLRLVVNELNHRVKNTLATIQAIASQTFRSAKDLEEAQSNFSARIMALARANDVLTGEHWEGALLRDIVAAASHVMSGAEPGRLSSSGPEVKLPPKAALSLAMAMHELATNAIKYGALSNAAGRVEVVWSVRPQADGDRLRIEWKELDGPPVSTPVRRGFGSRLVERGLAGELGGSVQLRFEPSGVVCVIEAPMNLYRNNA